LIGEAFVAVDEEYATECMCDNLFQIFFFNWILFFVIIVFLGGSLDCERKQQVL
jgi:hypothetical protein